MGGTVLDLLSAVEAKIPAALAALFFFVAVRGEASVPIRHFQADKNVSGWTAAFMADVDTDRDLLPDAQEDTLGTDPLDPDSDDDGFLDGEEVESGTNPLNSASFPNLLSGVLEALSGPLYGLLNLAAPPSFALDQTVMGQAFSVLNLAAPPLAAVNQSIMGPTVSILNTTPPPSADLQQTVMGPAFSVLNLAPPPLAPVDQSVFGPLLSILNTAAPPLAAVDHVLVAPSFSILNAAPPPDYAGQWALSYGTYHILNGYFDWLITLYSEPGEKTVLEGQTFTLKIRTHPADSTVARARMLAVFNDALLEIPRGAAGVVPSATFSTVYVKQVSAGEITLEVGAVGGGYSGGDCDIATVELRAKEPGSTVATRFNLVRTGSALLTGSSENVLGWAGGSALTIRPFVEPSPTPTPGWVWRRPDVLFQFSLVWRKSAPSGHPLDLLPDAVFDEGDLFRLVGHWQSETWPAPKTLPASPESDLALPTPLYR